MVIDVKTLLLGVLLTHLIQFGIFSYLHRTYRRMVGPGWWVLWSLFETVGLGIMILRGLTGFQTVAMILQGPLMIAGLFAFFAGIERFSGRRLNWTAIGIVFAVYVLVHLYFILITDNIDNRVVAFSGMAALLNFLAAGSFIRSRRLLSGWFAQLNAPVLILYGLVFTCRIVLVIADPYRSDLFRPSVFNVVLFLGGMVSGLIWTLSLVVIIGKRFNEEIAEVRDHFERIFRTIPDAALISRFSDGRIIEFNEGYSQVSGFSPDEIRGQTVPAIGVWADPDDRERILEEIRQRGFVRNLETTFRRKDGEIVTGLLSARRFEVAGEPCVLSITRDISERKKVLDELRKKNEELIRLNEERNRLYSIIAHDLRGPFNSILGLSEVIQDQIDNLSKEEIRKMLSGLHGSASLLYRLLENLLGWTGMLQGRVPFRPERIGVGEVVEDSVDLVANMAEAKQIRLEVDEMAGQAVFADPNMLRAILRNLLTNAVKFTPAGGTVGIGAVTGSDGWMRLTVSDTGIGMGPEILETLFSQDQRPTRRGTASESGSGIGLLLCQGFVNLHGGTLSVTSEPGKGSTFTVALPPE